MPQPPGPRPQMMMPKPQPHVTKSGAATPPPPPPPSDEAVGATLHHHAGRPYIYLNSMKASRWLHRASSGGADDWQIYRATAGREHVASRTFPGKTKYVDSLFKQMVRPPPPPASDTESEEDRMVFSFDYLRMQTYIRRDSL